MALAEQMGERLRRLSRSVSIRERLDFSCAVFDGRGRLIANAPHIPVHLGAMGETVRDLLRVRQGQLQPGQCWVSNDPYAGGSHLPDITVMAPVFLDSHGSPIAFVACRGHHVDVGGSTPGSLPPDATHIDQEGSVLRHVLLVDAGAFHRPELPGCREPAVVMADLEAQVAACMAGVDGVCALAAGMSADGLIAQMDHLRAHAYRCVAAVLQGMPGVHKGEEILDDGTTIQVRLEVDQQRGHLHIVAPAHDGNLNAPTAVARAALLYVFRVLVQHAGHQRVPLNEGSLGPFTVSVTPGGLFDPQWPRAVAGGNVETSQRLVDALLAAVGSMAASQGTMNNLTVGTARGAWYETIGGGSGAGSGFSGAHGVQVHMTNTRATDIEELEVRFPVRLHRWARRVGSGGIGRWPGGDGVIKEWVFLDAAEVSILAGRRDRGAKGLLGGGSGLRGIDERDVGAGWAPAPSSWTAKAGDRLRIQTPGGGGYGVLGEHNEE